MPAALFEGNRPPDATTAMPAAKSGGNIIAAAKHLVANPFGVLAAVRPTRRAFCHAAITKEQVTVNEAGTKRA
jgi:hypothetical protein